MFEMISANALNYTNHKINYKKEKERMYLKQLILKGFKSFADRSTLALEPGITAVVGPNGSGKSNISDAVLWVLGERNAKNLRGQVMQDVIFAGSTARKSVNVAEVTLVLDNSDGMLPIDFVDVAITRRMYRNGESDYLINNTIARRLDVLDILHDSGLGTGTHSIISQGHLDSILASKPEDRRALIEEAAGVLKHKQRKAKSVRKLEQMDNHLARVRDVVREVERQLGPLQRKARRAIQYKQASSDLHSVQLSLAVDELRKLQRKWDELLKKEAEENERLEQFGRELSAVQEKCDKLQEVIDAESSDVTALIQKQSRVETCAERLNSRSMLIEDAAARAQQRCTQLNASVQENANAARVAQHSRENAQARLTEINEKLARAETEVGAASLDFADAQKRREAAERELREGGRARGQAQQNIDKVRRELFAAQEKLAGASARVQAAAGLTQDLDARVSEAEDKVRAASDAFEKCNASLDAAKEACVQTDAVLKEARARESSARVALDAAKQNLTAQKSTLNALKQAQMVAAREASPARTYVLEHASAQMGTLETLSHVLNVDAGYEYLVETLLGKDALSLVAPGFESVRAASEILKAAGSAGLGIHEGSAGVSGSSDGALAGGSLSMILQNLAGDSLGTGEALGAERVISVSSDLNAAGINCVPLLSKVHVKSEYEGVVTALLGRVFVCETLSDALDAAARANFALRNNATGMRFVTRDANVVSTSGKVELVCGGGANARTGANANANAGGNASASAREVGEKNAAQMGQIAREARIKKCAATLRKLEAEAAELENAQAVAQAAAAQAHEKALQKKQDLATLTGNLKAAQNEVAAAKEQLDKAKIAQEQSAAGIKEAKNMVSATQPQVDALNTKLATLEREFEAARERVRDAQNNLDPARTAESAAQQKLSDAKLQKATLTQQQTYELHVVEQHSQELVRLAALDEAALSDLQTSQRVRRRTQPLLDTLGAIIASAAALQEKVACDVAGAQQAHAGMHTEISAAREEVRAAQNKTADQREVISRIRENKARLEVQVQSVADSIVQDLNTTMEAALEIPDVEDRPALEEEAARLTRKIKNMGAINPDAASEYEKLKARFDYLSTQLQDLSSARAALKKIDSVIEARMKDDFKNTFEQVNAHFQEIFAGLFPGGVATLSLTDPNDMENSGVEVSAQPRGKRITKMSLMSGGEKSLVALALLFAVYKTRATPFYILDEVEAALDDSNLVRLMNYLEALRESTQLIMITHQRRTMEAANVLFGVSMRSDGITKVVSQRLQTALEYAQ